MIKFITEQDKQVIHLFKNVCVNQFFIHKQGYLCQKSTGSSFCMIADEDGEPYSDYYDDIDGDYAIQKILPKVIKIEF